MLHVYKELCKKDVIFFDATGSIVRREPGYKDFQIYLFVRNPTKGKPGMPVDNFLTTNHDANTIGNFLRTFIRHSSAKLRSVKPRMIMIDGSKAVWNAVLEAFNRETRLQYYRRCYRIAQGNDTSNDFTGTFVADCFSHSMKAASIMCRKHYNKKFFSRCGWTIRSYITITVAPHKCI